MKRASGPAEPSEPSGGTTADVRCEGKRRERPSPKGPPCCGPPPRTQLSSEPLRGLLEPEPNRIALIGFGCFKVHKDASHYH